MKKLILFSEESVFSGNINCGIAEVVDSLAYSLTQLYTVIVICKEGNSKAAKKTTDFTEIKSGVLYGQFLQVHYYLISPELWPNAAFNLIDDIQPDILHNFDDPRVLSELKFSPEKTVYTFDDLEYLNDKIEYLKSYDFVTTFSKGYSDFILKQDNNIVQNLNNINFKKISIGISTEIFNPNNGLFIPYAYNKENLAGKDICKKRLTEKLGIPDCCIFLFMARLVKEKGLDNLIQSFSVFEENNAKFIIIGDGETKYKEVLTSLPKDGNIIYIEKYFFPAQALSFLAGADFYLQPSLMESGGLMPMAASQYGAIPIVTQNGGLRDNFDNNNAIIVNSSVSNSVLQALDLYNNKEALEEKRKVVMSQNFGWNNRKQGFIELYEAKN